MTREMDWVSYGKGIGIFLVVYGHLLSSSYNAGINISEHFFALSDSIVYSFHMPLFFLLSGIFVEQSLRKRGPGQFLLTKLRTIAYPYLIWSLLQTTIEVMFAGQTNYGITKYDIFAVIYKPWAQFWFLYALMWMHVVYTVISRFERHSPVMLGLLAIVLYFFPISTPIAALQGFSINLLFFAGGIYLRKYVIDSGKNYTIPLWLTIALFAALLASGIYIFENLIEPTRLTKGTHPVYFLYLSALGITACVGLSQYLSHTKKFRYIKLLGDYSLQIYLAHMLAGVAARIILLKVFNLTNPVLHVSIVIFVALAAPIVIYKVAKRIHFPYLFELTKPSA